MSRLYEETEKMYIEEYTEKYLQLADILYENYNDIYNDVFDESLMFEAGSRVNTVKDTVKKVKRVDKAVSDKVDANFDRILKDLRKKIIGQSREEIINNRTKLSTIIKRAATVGGGVLIHPVLGLIVLFTQITVRKGLKEREKNRILADIKGELEIVEEKIKDADNNNDRASKYELMRLRRELKKQEEKIRYARFIKD